MVTRPAILRELTRPSPGWARRVGTLTAPVLAIGGGPTSEVDQDGLEALTRAIPNGTWTTIDAGHNIHPSRPKEFVAVVRDWLADQR